jgi:hypothetical protein
MRRANNAAGRERAGLGLDAFVRFVLVVARRSRCAPYRFRRFTFEEIRREPTHELAWDRCVVAIRRPRHPGAVTRPPVTGETNEAASDDKVSDVADAGCMFHVREIDTRTLDPELPQSCPRVDGELTTQRNPLRPNAYSDFADRP